MDKEPELPSKSDRLFKTHNEDYKHNAVLSSGMNKLSLYSTAYKTAALKLYGQLDGNAFDANMTVYPLIFLNRQFLELALKELISGLTYTTKQQYDFRVIHGLKDLWDDYKKLLLEVGGQTVPEQDVLDTVEALLVEFNRVDPISFSFRYPVDKAKKPSLTMTNIDLKNFMDVMEKLYAYFEWQSFMVSKLIDFTDEMMAYYSF